MSHSLLLLTLAVSTLLVTLNGAIVLIIFCDHFIKILCSLPVLVKLRLIICIHAHIIPISNTKNKVPIISSFFLQSHHIATSCVTHKIFIIYPLQAAILSKKPFLKNSVAIWRNSSFLPSFFPRTENPWLSILNRVCRSNALFDMQETPSYFVGTYQ